MINWVVYERIGSGKDEMLPNSQISQHALKCKRWKRSNPCATNQHMNYQIAVAHDLASDFNAEGQELVVWPYFCHEIRWSPATNYVLYGPLLC